MKAKLKNVLLIDDDNITNFLHKGLLLQAKIAENISIAETVTEALEILEIRSDNRKEHPELIFIDLNMPGLNGWDFIDEFKKIKDYNSTDSVIVMLTTSINPDDNKKANQISEVAEYRRKPMTLNMINEIANKYFEEN